MKIYFLTLKKIISLYYNSCIITYLKLDLEYINKRVKEYN